MLPTSGLASDARPRAADQPLVSVVMPVFCEARTLPELLTRLDAVAASLPQYRFEYILVDDGSPDDTLKVAERLALMHPLLTGVSLRRNYGQTAALRRARGRRGVRRRRLDGRRPAATFRSCFRRCSRRSNAATTWSADGARIGRKASSGGGRRARPTG